MLENEIPTGKSPRVDAFVEASLVEAIDAPPSRARRTRLAVDGVLRP